MKKIITIIIIAFFGFTGISLGFDKPTYNYSTAAVDCILQYYSAMAEYEKAKKGTTPAVDRLKVTCKMIQENKKDIVHELMNSKGIDNIETVKEVVENYIKRNIHHGYATNKKKVTGKLYFDTRTGHKYIRLLNGTYDEYTKKGRFFKNVNPDLPLLTRNSKVFNISMDSYILYKKPSTHQSPYLYLPGSDNHPDGWMADSLMTSLK